MLYRTMARAAMGRRGTPHRQVQRLFGGMLLVAAVIGTTACGRAATIQRQGAPTVRERIVGGTPDGVVLASGAVEKSTTDKESTTGGERPMTGGERP